MQPTSFQSYLESLHDRFSDLRSGEVATYIPELARADPEKFGIALVTIHGHVYQAGDSRHPFSIQSISKPFVYGMALEDSGPDHVAAKIDVEPSGEAFNSISLEPVTGRPRNPMINAGAIVATSLVDGEDADAKTERILTKIGAYAGHDLVVDESTYRSELETGHRNRAIAHLLRNYEILQGDPELPLDAYFRQCSVMVTARDLALMGACLANDGVNPITGIRALESRHVPSVLSVMASCGMYDYSGNWIYQVGMPAKSGVGGGTVAVLPGQFGLAVYSPRLNSKWNSVRGIAVCEALSEDFGMHMLRMTRNSTTSVIRSIYTAREIRSKLVRDLPSDTFIGRHRDRILVMELTGELTFVTAETLVARATHEMAHRQFLILDLKRVSAIDQSAAILLAETVQSIIEQGKTTLFTGWHAHYAFHRTIQRIFQGSEHKPEFGLQDIDRALEFAENALLQESGDQMGFDNGAPVSEQPLCIGLSQPEMDLLESILVRNHYRRNTIICREGETADRIFFLCRGRVTVKLNLSQKQDTRLCSFQAGSAFGESAFFPDGRRNADIVAETDVEVAELEPRLLENNPDHVATSLLSKLMANFAEQNLNRLAEANQEIRTLSR